MSEQIESFSSGITRPALKTPRAAAVAGIIFALLYGGSTLMIRLSVPVNLAAGTEWMAHYQGAVQISLALLPFAGIAFLWFMGVVRDRLGRWEDQFFSTVFFGSGILLIAMLFVSGALSGALLSIYSLNPEMLHSNGVYAVNRAAIHQIVNVYGIKMAGVFMMSLGTIWLHTQIMPRWIVIATYGLALLLIVVITFNAWITLVFPAWVLVVSVYILLAHPDASVKPVGEGRNVHP